MRRLCPGGRATIASAAKSAGEAIGREGLEEIVDALASKASSGVLVVRGDENGDGHLVGADGFDDTKAIHLRHLDVEEDEVGVGAADGFNGGFAIAALTDDIDVRLVLEQTQERLAGKGLIIDDEGTKRHEAAPTRRAVGLRRMPKRDEDECDDAASSEGAQEERAGAVELFEASFCIADADAAQA